MFGTVLPESIAHRPKKGPPRRIATGLQNSVVDARIDGNLKAGEPAKYAEINRAVAVESPTEPTLVTISPAPLAEKAASPI